MFPLFYKDTSTPRMILVVLLKVEGMCIDENDYCTSDFL